MKRWFPVLCAAALAACGGGKQPLSLTDFSCNGACNDLTTQDASSAEVAVSGAVIDPEKLATVLAKDPSVTASLLLATSCVANATVFAFYGDGTMTSQVMSDASCNYSLSVKANSPIHMAGTASSFSTYSQTVVLVGTTPLENVAVDVLTGQNFSAEAGVAALLSTPIATLAQHGLCVAFTLDKFTPPFVAFTSSSIAISITGFTPYALTDSTTTPPTFMQQASSMQGTYGIYDPSNATDTTIGVTATATIGANTYATLYCDVKPGYFTFAPMTPQ
jgi:hypothetical protein